MMNTRGKPVGFTLIELMVAVSVISIITAIAVPNMLRSRMAANETATIAGLRTLATAQHMFRRTDYDGDGVREYAYYDELTAVWRPGPDWMWYQDRINLIDPALAKAHRWWSPLVWGQTIPRNGYYFNDPWAYYDANWNYTPCADSVGHNWVVLRFGFTATPASYQGTGVNVYAINDAGVIYQKDGAQSPVYVDSDCLWLIWDDGAMKAKRWVVVE